MRVLAVLTLCMVANFHAQAQTQGRASVSYSPDWRIRHHLQILADRAGLPIPISHWPQPLDAVWRAVDGLSEERLADDALILAWQSVLQDLRLRQSQPAVRAHLRTRAESMPGFDESYVPGSRLALTSGESQWQAGRFSLALRLGARLEESPNALQSSFDGWAAEGRYQMWPDDSALVLGWNGWNLKAFSQRNWWGPGWQSSLVNGHNSPAWIGVGVQRGDSQPSEHSWLHRLGPWNFDLFVAQARDPLTVTGQPSGFLFSGMRLSVRPWPWLEAGFSRGMQAGGAGRPSGLRNFAKSFLGKEVNKNPDDAFEDSSGQIAGYDFRFRCPVAMGACAIYTQWMGEDAAGDPPLPYKFMSLWGAETVIDQGRQRLFAEYADTHMNSLPWESPPSPGYVNGVYSQGYTNGARWIGSAQGAGSRVLTLGWMNVSTERFLKLHTGRIGTSIGSYAPLVDAPRGRLFGFSARQTIRYGAWSMTPELTVLNLDTGEDQRASRRRNIQLGVELALPIH
jgi:hypothetical protein